MNKDQLEGKWKQMKGSFKQKWGEISDDKIEQADGKREELAGLIQEQYGMTKERAEEVFDKWATRCDEKEDTWESMWHNVQGRWTEAIGHFKAEYGKVTENELMESRGQRDILAGIIAREYDVSQGDAYEIVDDWAYGSMKSPDLTGGKK